MPVVRRFAAATATALALAAAGCSQKDQLQPEHTQTFLVSEEREIKIGEAVAEEIEREFPLYDEPRLAAYVAEVGTKLASVSERPNLPYRFRVLDSPIPNAFAAPGGFIYITRGILGVIDDEAEMAGVLGHEIGHVAARHGPKQIQAGMLTQLGLVVAAVVAGDQVSGDFWRGVNVATNLIFLGYSRSDEHQADLLGAKYLYRAGYDMEGMIGVMEGLMELQDRSPLSAEQYFRSHPLTRDRIAHLRSWLPRIPREDVWGGVVPSRHVRNETRYQRLAAPYAIYPGADEIAQIVENFRVGLVRRQMDLILSVLSDDYRDSRGRTKSDVKRDLEAFFANAVRVTYRVKDLETETRRDGGTARYRYEMTIWRRDGAKVEETGRVRMEFVRPEARTWRITALEETPGA